MSIDLPVAILCGGRGTRLGKLTENTPKSLVKVCGVHFIHRQLGWLEKQGVKKVVLCISHLGEQIRGVVGESFGNIKVEYSDDGTALKEFVDGAPPLGTIGAIRKAAPLLGDEFLTLYGDSWLPDIDLAEFITSARAAKAPFVQTRWNGVDYGITYFTHPWKQVLPHFVRDIGEVGQRAEAAYYRAPNRFYQMGDPEGLAEVEALLSGKNQIVVGGGAITFPIPFTARFLGYAGSVAELLETTDATMIERMVDDLILLRERKGRLFFAGLGGSAANASHACNDFRKLCNIDALTATDNVSEFSARANDDGWRAPFVGHMEVSKFSKNDCLFVLSVGGGQDTAPATSVGIAYAVQHANRIGAPVLGIVGRDGGYTAKHWTCGVIVPTVNEKLVTPITESFQSILLHCLVSHPKLQLLPTRW